MWLILFVLGFILLIKGADIMVDGAASIAHKFGVSTFVIGLTVIAFGTSAPELAVSVLASINGSAGIALGNIIGSNISNTLLILGIVAIISPLLVRKATVNKEIPFSLLAIFAVGILANDFLIDKVAFSGLTRIDGLVLILFFTIFVYYTFGITKSEEGIITKTISGLKEGGPEEFPLWKSIIFIALGLVGLSVGGKWIVDGAIMIASFFNLSEAFIGLTIVAVGTSLPELAASAVAAYKGNVDIAIGNIIGSNIFNLLWVLGLSSSISPIIYDLSLNVDLAVLTLVTVLLLFLIYLGKKNILEKFEGIILVSLYVCYLVFLVIRG